MKNKKKMPRYPRWFRKTHLKIALFALAIAIAGSVYLYFARAQEVITVDVTRVLQTGTAGGSRLGINTNYWWDAQTNRVAGAKPLSSSLTDMGAKYWRYPGGEKADGYLWSTPPFAGPNPRLARISSQDWPSNDPRYWTPAGSPSGTWAHAIYDFDKFMADCQAAQCTPVIVTAYDGIYKAANTGGTSLTRQQAIDTAVAWVHYAKSKGYAIKYWEIGNETWLPGYMGADPGRVQQASDFVQFCQAMKQADPTILCGTSANSSADWNTLLANAATSIDFMSIHSYGSWGYKDYASYQSGNLYPNNKVDEAWQALQNYPTHKDRIKMMVTETGGMTYGVNGTWTQADLGHALMTFDTLAQLQQDKRVEFSQFWNTRWVNQNTQGNIWPATQSEFDALKPDNNPSLQGLALKLFANYSLSNMVSATGSSAVRSYASHDPATGKLNVWLVNKNTASTSVALNLQNYTAAASAAVSVLKGSGPYDMSAGFGPVGPAPVTNNTASLTLSPVSITVIEFNNAASGSGSTGSGATTTPPPSPTPTTSPTPVPVPSPTPTSPPAAPTNKALNKPATASSAAKGNPAGQAVDGITSTRWQTAKKSTLNAEWITVDLGTSSTISKVVIDQGDRWATIYAIKASQDGVSWTTVASTAAGSQGSVTYPLTSVNARYVRMESTRWRNYADRVKLNELAVY